MKQHIPGLGREAEAAGQGGAGAAAPFPDTAALEAQSSGGKEQKLGSRLRGFLGGKKKEGGGSSGAAGAHGCPASCRDGSLAKSESTQRVSETGGSAQSTP